MENEVVENAQQEEIKDIYQYASDLKNIQNKNPFEVRKILIEKGVSPETATAVSESLNGNTDGGSGLKDGTKDMIFGALWCIGGTVLTLSNIGYIFYGAIIFGAIQFIKGLVNSQK